MVKTRVVTAIKTVLDSDCGFDAFVKMKGTTSTDNTNLVAIKRINLDEGDPVKGDGGFKASVRAHIETTLRNKFLAEDAEYSLAEHIADNQNKFYAVRQDNNYKPFDVINTSDEQISAFNESDVGKAEGFLFRFAIPGHPPVWAYQHMWPASIPNKKKENIMIKWLSKDNVFVEVKETLFTISRKVDLIIVSSLSEEELVTEIVTTNISLMERNFGLETFIRNSANEAASAISSFGLVANTEKVSAYLTRSNSAKRYSKKMMRVRNSKVFDLSVEELREKVTTLERWKETFTFDANNQIVLNSFDEVEKLIDLFDERYTRSDVTGQEYDTSAKTLPYDSTLTT